MLLHFLTYHRTEDTPSARDYHVLSNRKFARQVALLNESGVTVARSDLFRTFVDDGSYQIGLTFDDGYASDLANADLLARNGMGAFFFISTSNLGRTGYLTAADVRTLESMGMSVGSHSHRHVQLTGLSREESRREMATSKAVLEDILGHAVDLIAFPGGAFDRRIANQAFMIGYVHLFSTKWGCNKITRIERMIYRRSIVVQRLTDDKFLDLVKLRNAGLNQALYAAKEIIKLIMGKNAYTRLRNFILSGK